MSKTILVTGGTGFIGSFLVEKLKSKGHNVRISSRSEGDLRDPDYCKQICTDIDVLYHLASHRKNVSYHRENAQEIYDDNTSMTEALIEGLRQSNVSRIVFFSTIAAGEVDLESNTVGGVFDGYVVSKAACERKWMEYAEAHNIPLLTVRPVGIYGPRDYFADDGNVIPALIVRSDHAQDTLSVWGSGNQLRSFLYVEDCVNAVLQLGACTGIVALASPEQGTVRELSEKIVSIINPDLDIHFDTTKPEGLDSPEIPIPEELSHFPWTSLQEGLEKTVEWYKLSTHERS